MKNICLHSEHATMWDSISPRKTSTGFNPSKCVREYMRIDGDPQHIFIRNKNIMVKANSIPRYWVDLTWMKPYTT